MTKNFKEMTFRLVTEVDGWGVYYCLATKQFYTKGRRYEMIVEFNPVLLEQDAKKYEKIYQQNIIEGFYDSG